MSGVWHQLILSRHAACLTHGSLALLTIVLFLLLLRLPLRLAFVPCAIIHHRIGMLLHEYIHAIPFARKQINRLLLNVFDGLLLGFGIAEFFRVAHLKHHRWLNTAGDPGFSSPDTSSRGRGFVPLLLNVEGLQYVRYFLQVARGKTIRVLFPYMLAAALQSVFWIAFWVHIGRADIPAGLFLLTVFNALIPTSLRSAIEHNGRDSDGLPANDYKVLIPMFNINRHIHHHEDPRRPWYLLEYRSSHPLNTMDYFTYWWRLHVTKELHLLPPAAGRVTRQSPDDERPALGGLEDRG